MRVEDAAAELERHFARRGEVEAALTPAEAAASMLAFYRDIRAEGCDVEQAGDMLLFQWGTHDWGGGPRFEIDVTRQFIVGVGDDDDITQLHLTFRFEPDEDLRALGAGNRWCRSPKELTEFTAFVESHPAYRAVGRRADGEQDFAMERV
jgi:hypothetical protein